LPARPRRPSDKLLRGIDALDERRRQILVHADRLCDGHLDGAPGRTGPDTRRSRRIDQRPLIPTHPALPLVVRHADRHRPRAGCTPAIVGREADLVDAAVAIAFPLSADAGSGGPDTRRIGTGVPLAPTVGRLVLSDAGDGDGDRIPVRVRHSDDRYVHESMV